jgi:hypothetical protein
MENINIPLSEYIELLEIKLTSLQCAYEYDSSWNYGIPELEEKIEKLKAENRSKQAV